jgi:hypothetical protein
MIARCMNPKAHRYDLYGGRGISVCERWVESFESFLSDMGQRPSDGHSLDRFPDKDGNYEPGNVRWATHQEQMLNRRPWKWSESARLRHKIGPGSLSKIDWDAVVSEVAKNERGLRAIAKDFGITQPAISSMLRRRGTPAEVLRKSGVC